MTVCLRFRVCKTTFRFKLLHELFNRRINLQEPPPDIILLDADLPIRNGVEVGRQLKSHHSTRNVPVIMVSANPFVDDLSREAGAIDFVQKPFTLKTLIQKVEDHLAFSA